MYSFVIIILCYKGIKINKLIHIMYFYFTGVLVVTFYFIPKIYPYYFILDILRFCQKGSQCVLFSPEVIIIGNIYLNENILISLANQYTTLAKYNIFHFINELRLQFKLVKLVFKLNIS